MIYKEPLRSEAALPEPLATRLVDAVTPAAPPVAVAERIHRRLLDRVRADAPAAACAESSPAGPSGSQALIDAFITLRGSTQSGDGWIELLPKAHAKLLFTDGEAESYMIRLEPGAWAPAHEHPADEECLVLEGSLWQGDVFLQAGDFHVARPGMKHGELRTETGALVFIRYGKPLAQFIRM